MGGVLVQLCARGLIKKCHGSFGHADRTCGSSPAAQAASPYVHDHRTASFANLYFPAPLIGA